MRILSLGFPLPGVALDNYSFASAPSFFDYDAIVADPSAFAQLIQDVVAGTKEHTTRSGERVVASAAAAHEIDLGSLLAQRHAETERLLSNGGLVVTFAHPNATHETFDCYGWLPAPEGVSYREPFLERGSGTGVTVAEDSHPFAPLIAAWRERLAYHAHFDTRDGQVFARSAGGAAIAVELRYGDGRIVFLPPPAKPLAGDQRYAFSEALQAAIHQTLRQDAKSAPPAWVATYAQEKPVRPPEGAQKGPGAFLDGLLWQEGVHGLGEPVRAAFARLGCRVAPDDVDQPAQLHLGGQTVFLELEGNLDAVGMEAHYRLRRRLEEAITRGRPKRGVLVINGCRAQDPSQRAAQYTEPLRIAAETMRYCIVTSVQLYDAVATCDDARAQRFRELLLTTEGVLPDE
jgi:hypothetical protein